jgi:ubiquinone/menaquinone biosynthesis C-methylase UbiE
MDKQTRKNWLKFSVNGGVKDSYLASKEGTIVERLFHKVSLITLKHLIKKYVAHSNKILDIGIGHGLELEVFNHKNQVVGLDVCKEALNKCKKYAELRGSPIPKLVHGSCYNLPFPPSSFDTVVTINTLHRLDINRAFKEIEKVLKKDGILLILGPTGLVWNKKIRKILTKSTGYKWKKEPPVKKYTKKDYKNAQTKKLKFIKSGLALTLIQRWAIFKKV